MKMKRKSALVIGYSRVFSVADYEFSVKSSFGFVNIHSIFNLVFFISVFFFRIQKMPKFRLPSHWYLHSRYNYIYSVKV